MSRPEFLVVLSQRHRRRSVDGKAAFGLLVKNDFELGFGQQPANTQPVSGGVFETNEVAPAIDIEVSRGGGIIGAASVCVAAQNLERASQLSTGVAIGRQVKCATERFATETLAAAPVGGGYGAVRVASYHLGALESAGGQAQAGIQELAFGCDIYRISLALVRQ